MEIPVPCLSCGQALHQVTISGVEVEACVEGCGGIWFDAAELKRFNQDGAGCEDPVLAQLLELPLQENTSAEKRICLKCGGKMKEHEYREKSGIFIDECYSCGGIWLDGGELKAIRNSLAVQQSDQERAEDERRFSESVIEERQRKPEKSNLSKAVRVICRSMRVGRFS